MFSHRQYRVPRSEWKKATHFEQIYTYAFLTLACILGLVVYIVGLIATNGIFDSWNFFSWIPWTIVFVILCCVVVLLWARYSLGSIEVTPEPSQHSSSSHEEPLYGEYAHGYQGVHSPPFHIFSSEEEPSSSYPEEVPLQNTSE